MASHNDVGDEGEELAVKWLVKQGFEIIHRNWRYKWYEIDIIAMKDNRLHIIEVKTRKGDYFGRPEDSVRRKKFRDLQKAADEFLFLNRNKDYKWMRYDILAITIVDGKEPDYYFVEDVYLW